MNEALGCFREADLGTPMIGALTLIIGEMLKKLYLLHT